MYNPHDDQYHNLLRIILKYGTHKTDRTGVGTKSWFGHQLRFNLANGFPLLTTKRMFTKGIIHELLWFLRGDTNVKYLQDNGVHIWDAWADKDGNLGPVYGHAWRQFPNTSLMEGAWFSEDDKPWGERAPDNAGELRLRWEGTDAQWLRPMAIDQIRESLELLRTTPDSRRIIVTAWNPGDIHRVALAPCHCLFQFNTRPLSPAERYARALDSDVSFERINTLDWDDAPGLRMITEAMDEARVPKHYLDCQLYQRSADVFLGVPFNIASYALLTHMFAHVLDMVPGHFVHTFGDVHIYNNHVDQVKLQLSRLSHKAPTIGFKRKITDINDFQFSDIFINNYISHPPIEAPIAV